MNNSESKKKSVRSVYHTIFMSYILLSIVTLGICGIGFLHLYRYFNEGIIDTAQRHVQLAGKLVERQCLMTNDVLEMLSNDTTFKEFTGYSNEQFERYGNSISTFRTNVTNNSSISQCCNEVYFYFIDSDSLFGLKTSRYSGDLMDRFFSSVGLDRETFNSLIRFKGLQSSMVLDDGSVWFMRSCYNDERQRVAVIIANVKLSGIPQELQQYYPENSLVIARDDTVILSSVQGGAVSVSTLLSGRKDSNDMVRVEINGERYRSLSQPVRGLGWQCFVLIPEAILYTGLFSFWRIAAFLMAGAILITMYMARRLTSRTYAPVKQIISMMHEEGDSDFPETYDNVIKALTKLKADNKELHTTEREYRQKQIENSVRQVLNGEITEPAVEKQILQDWAELGEDDVFCLALIHVTVPHDNHVFEVNSQGVMNADSIDLMGFILKNILDERLFSKFEGRLMSDGNEFLVLVHCNKARHGQVYDILGECMAFLRQSMKTQPTAILSDCVENTELMSQLYKTLLDELAYNQFWHSGSEDTLVVQLGNLDEYAEKFSNDRFVMYSGRLMNYLEVQDFVAAWRCLDELIDNTFPKDRKHLKQNLYRMYGLIGTITTFMDIPDADLFANMNYEERLFAVENITEFKQLIHDIFEKIIEYKSNNEDSAPVWVEQVNDYIKKNYKDINLTVSSLADTFDVSVSHLSRTFKQYTGTGALDRIHEVRIAEAKELLLQGLSVEETAQQCGYLDAKALRRAFTNYEGVTPGKFREAGIRRVLAD